MTARRSSDGVWRERDSSLLFDAGESGVKAPREPAYHRGVLRVAGARHVGRAARRSALYVSDARAYDRTGFGEIDHGLEQIAARVHECDEHARRSWVLAVASLLEWVAGDTSLGGAR
jgi:hypothetical protein